jgi:hypothetical protein
MLLDSRGDCLDSFTVLVFDELFQSHDYLLILLFSPRTSTPRPNSHLGAVMENNAVSILARSFLTAL